LRIEQRAEVDHVHVKDKSTCSSDALTSWEEVNKFEKEKIIRLIFFLLQLIEK